MTVVREFDGERERQATLMQRLLQEAQLGPPSPSNHTTHSTHSREEAESQRCRADREAAELTHVRCMARQILQQRSEVEHFLLDALQEVKKEVAASRSGPLPLSSQPSLSAGPSTARMQLWPTRQR